MLFKYFLALLPMIITYVVGIGLTEFGAYEVWYPTSPIMHGIGGFVTAWTAFMIWKMHASPKQLQSLPKYSIVFVLVGITVLVGVAWEWYEFILDVLFHTGHILGVGDTLLDLTMDTVGALVYSIVAVRIDK